MISVCMASYNGEKYIKKQIDTILINLSACDELVISDDMSTDRTRAIIEAYMVADNRINLVDGPKKGVIANFENAICHARGDFIYLADQDDLWDERKVERVQACFEKKTCILVIHDADIIDGNDRVVETSFFARRGSKSGVINNVIKNSYIGCCMAFRKELLNIALPIPRNIEMHDQWLGILAEVKGDVVFLDEILFHYRRHGDNVSSLSHYPIPKMLKNRIVFVFEFTKRLIAKRNK